MQIPLSQPDINDNDVAAVTAALRSGYLSLGPQLERFEKAFSTYMGTQYAVAVANGTAALDVSLKACNIATGASVITTPFSFISSANAILFQQARVVFVDIDPVTLTIDTTKIEHAIDKTTRAILPVHIFGMPCDMDAICVLADKNNLVIVEDACEAIGAEYNGKKAGSFGTCGTFAFYPNKQMTTGEGGIVVTDDEQLAAVMKSTRNQGRPVLTSKVKSEGEKNWLLHDRLGYNYRLDEMSCALGITQLERIASILAKRNEVAQYYNEKLVPVEEVQILQEVPNRTRSWFVYVVLLAENISRDGVLDYLTSKGVQCRNYFHPIHLQPFYQRKFGYKEGDFPVSEDAGRRAVALPFYNDLTNDKIDFVVECLKSAIMKNKKY